MEGKFYDRKKEIAYLMQVENQSKESACFTLMTRNTEAVICGEWQKELE